jgi:hypothetical protein
MVTFDLYVFLRQSAESAILIQSVRQLLKVGIIISLNLDTNKVISNKEYMALIIVSASWVYFVGANLFFALSYWANTIFAPTIA